MADITTKTTENSVRIYIGGILHISLRRAEWIGMQAWENHGEYWIEYSFSGQQSLKSMYDGREKWLAVLAELDKVEYGYGD